MNTKILKRITAIMVTTCLLNTSFVHVEAKDVYNLNERNSNSSDYMQAPYYNDVIWEEHFTTPMVADDQSISAKGTVQECNVAFYIHYNKNRGLWLSVLIDMTRHTKDTLIKDVSGTWLYRKQGEASNRSSTFYNPVLIDRWSVNTEYDIGAKYKSGDQIWAQVQASAKLKKGYVPTFTRSAIATIP